MTVRLTLHCDGCDRPVPLQSDLIEIPEGWIACDAFTRRTYCSDCWATIPESERELRLPVNDNDA